MEGSAANFYEAFPFIGKLNHKGSKGTKVFKTQSFFILSFSF